MPQLAHCAASCVSWSQLAANFAQVLGPLAVYKPALSPNECMKSATALKPLGNLSGLATCSPLGPRAASIQQSLWCRGGEGWGRSRGRQSGRGWRGRKNALAVDVFVPRLLEARVVQGLRGRIQDSGGDPAVIVIPRVESHGGSCVARGRGGEGAGQGVGVCQGSIPLSILRGRARAFSHAFSHHALRATSQAVAAAMVAAAIAQRIRSYGVGELECWSWGRPPGGQGPCECVSVRVQNDPMAKMHLAITLFCLVLPRRRQARPRCSPRVGRRLRCPGGRLAPILPRSTAHWEAMAPGAPAAARPGCLYCACRAGGISAQEAGKQALIFIRDGFDPASLRAARVPAKELIDADYELAALHWWLPNQRNI